MKLKKVKSKKLNIEHEYYNFGSKRKPVLIMLHGVNSTAKTFESMKRLGKKYNVYSYNFPETSEYYKGRIENFADLVYDFLDLMKLYDINLCGASHGGIVATKMLAMSNKLEYFDFYIHKLFLISSFVSCDSMWEKIKYYSLYFIMKFLDDKTVEKVMGMAIKKVADKNKGILKSIKVKPAEYYRQCVSSIVHYRGDYDVKTIYIPTVIIHGRKDDSVKPKRGIRLYKKILNSSLILVGEGNHVMAYMMGDELVKYF